MDNNVIQHYMEMQKSQRVAIDEARRARLKRRGSVRYPG